MSGIDPRTEIGTVHLTVTDLDRARTFYERALGLQATESDGAVLRLGAAGGIPLLELHGDPSATPLDHRLTGLFHFAVLVPTRPDLALALVRLLRAGWQLTGASDHLVSEALYLHDPDGNGIEIYRDRPQSEWSHDAAGELRMATLPLDLHDLLNEVDGELAAAQDPEHQLAGMPPATRMGHVHLQVSELNEIERFYEDVVGFDVMVRTYPGALFVSAGGYHHHIGLNTWNSRGAGAPPEGMVGLRAFEVRMPHQGAFEAVVRRIETAGASVQRDGETALVRDPSGNGVLLTH
jgi:catechol 2,3-dioxygenase